MYRIVAYDSPTDTVGHVVFDPRINRYISEGKLTQKESEIDDLQLTVNQHNYLFGRVKPFQTHIEVYQDNKMIFRGRALDLTRMMKDSGQFVQSFVFEDVQNYLKDTCQRWAKIQNTTPEQLFRKIINTHNSQVPDYKKFVVETVDVTNNTDNVYRYIEDGATTWDTIKDKLIDRLGGYIKIEYLGQKNHISYYQQPGKEHPNDTPIQVAKNLQSASVQIDPTEVITQLVPLGATIENGSPDANPDTTVSQPRIDIKSVNGGRDYLDIPRLQEEFGIIRKSVVWEDVHQPNILLTKAKHWVNDEKQASAKEVWNIEAIELVNQRFESFKVSDHYLFDNLGVASRQMLKIAQKTIDFANPNKSTLTIADKSVKLSEYQLENRNALKSVQQLHSRVQSYGIQISSLNNIISDQQKVIDSISKRPIQARKVAIVGDSYSTYIGWNPSGNPVYFDGTNNNVTDVSQTWWYMVISALKANLFLNESYSGSTIANIGYNGEEVGKISLLTRGLNKFGASLALQNRPDIIFIYGGLNDTWAGTPAGQPQYEDWTDNDLQQVLPAFSKLVNDLLIYNPNVQLVNIVSDLVSNQISDGMAEITQHFGITNIQLENLTIVNHHPTDVGMKQISEQIISALEKGGIISG